MSLAGVEEGKDDIECRGLDIGFNGGGGEGEGRAKRAQKIRDAMGGTELVKDTKVVCQRNSCICTVVGTSRGRGVGKGDLFSKRARTNDNFLIRRTISGRVGSGGNSRRRHHGELGG